MPIGGGKFTLEKTWKTTASSTTTLNSPGNVTFPYGKYDGYVEGRAQSGNPYTPSYTNYNPGSGGNAYYNPGSGGNYAGSNPGSGGNYAGTNPYTPGYNASAYGSGSMFASAEWYCSGTFQARYLSYTFGGAREFNYPPSSTYYTTTGSGCPAPQYAFVTYPPELYYYPVPGSGGNPYYNPYYPGSAYYNPYYPGNFAGYNPYYPGNASGSNPAVPGNPGAAANVLGVYFPGGAPNSTAPYVSPTKIDRYVYPDGATYPVSVPSGGYVTIYR